LDFLYSRAGISDDLHLVTEGVVRARHRSEGLETGAGNCERVGARVKASDVQATGAHGFSLRSVRLHRKELDLLARQFLHVREKSFPDVGVN